MSEGEIRHDMTPRIGAQWQDRPNNVDCLRCWPSPGWGHRPNRKGKQKWEDKVQVSMRDVKGVCFFCAGTGILPIPLNEVMKDPPWTEEDAKRWRHDK